MKQFIQPFAGTDVKQFGLTVVYGTKNFVSRDVLNTQPEALAVVLPADVCKRFANGDITEDEAVNLADVYMSERDSNDMKKIKVTLQ